MTYISDFLTFVDAITGHLPLPVNVSDWSSILASSLETVTKVKE